MSRSALFSQFTAGPPELAGFGGIHMNGKGVQAESDQAEKRDAFADRDNLYQTTLFEPDFAAIGVRLGNAPGFQDALTFRPLNRRVSASVRECSRFVECRGTQKAEARAIPVLMEAFWKPELPAPYWAEVKLRLSQLRAPSMHALVVDLAEARCPFLSPDIAPDLFRRRGYALY